MVSKSQRITKQDKKDFLNALKLATAEKDVEIAYRQIFQKYYGGQFETSISNQKTDGFLDADKDQFLLEEGKKLRLLLEVKWQKNFGDGDRQKLIAQVIHYMKHFQLAGHVLPNVIVGGDENEIFTLYAPKLIHYLDENFDWSLAPSSADQDKKLLRALEEDANLKDLMVYYIDKDFDMDDVLKDINALREIGKFEPLHIDETNLRKAFDRFVRMVFDDGRWLIGARSLGATEIVSIFIRSILGSNDILIDERHPNILRDGQKEIRISGPAYHAFFSRYDRRYKKHEIDKINAIADQLIEELERRFKGDFWTPTIWAEEAIKMMERDLGPDFREKYVVWDPAAGTKNLTRDYKFSHLFSSTIHKSEIEIGKKYNPGAISFQYDFLNDDIDVNPNSDPRDLKMPKQLFEALKTNKPIVFYTNPPYGQATEQGSTSKTGVAQTKIGSLMKKKDFGLASAELYTQFIFRVQKIARDFHLTNIFFFFFFNKGFLISPAFEKFTDQLLDQFKFNDGFMMNAGEFQGTSSNWGIIFSNFEIKKKQSERQKLFKYTIKKSGDFGVEDFTTHILSRVSKGESISDWLSEIKITKDKFNDGNFPRTTGGFNITTGKTFSGYLRKGAIGFMHNGGSSVQFSDKYTNLNSTMNFVDHGSSVLPENFERICVTFACRKSILPDASWINDKDVFRRPSEEFQNSSEWTEFVRDCVVFSLFHRSSYQTSLRNFEYNDEFYNVYNEWFFMPVEKISALADEYYLMDIIDDARNADERFVYKYLHNEDGRKINLSSEARELLLAGEEFIISCFPKRETVDREHPEWHLMTWDAGYYQSYKIYTENKDDSKIVEAYNKLDSARTRLETKIRHRVYQDGILLK